MKHLTPWNPFIELRHYFADFKACPGTGLKGWALALARRERSAVGTTTLSVEEREELRVRKGRTQEHGREGMASLGF